MSMAIKVSKAGHRGDPGIFGSILGGITGAVGGFITGGPTGALGGALRGAGIIKPPQPMPGTGYVGGGPMILPPAPGAGGGGLLGRVMRRGAGITGVPLPPPMRMGGGGVPARIPTQATGMPPGMNGGPKPFYPASGPPPGPGYKLNKSGYWRVSPAGTPFYVEPGTMWVKKRRRNPANAKASDRAISRIDSAKRYQKRLGRVSIRKKCPH